MDAELVGAVHFAVYDVEAVDGDAVGSAEVAAAEFEAGVAVDVLCYLAENEILGYLRNPCENMENERNWKLFGLVVSSQSSSDVPSSVNNSGRLRVGPCGLDIC